MAIANPNLSSFIWSVADLLRGDYKQSSATVQGGLKDILLNHAHLYEALRERVAA